MKWKGMRKTDITSSVISNLKKKRWGGKTNFKEWREKYFKKCVNTGHHTKEWVKAGGVHKVEGALWNIDIRKTENGRTGWCGNWRKLIHEGTKTRWSRRNNITVYDNHRSGRNEWSIYSAGGTYIYSWRTKKRHCSHCLRAAICTYFEITAGIDL